MVGYGGQLRRHSLFSAPTRWLFILGCVAWLLACQKQTPPKAPPSQPVSLPTQPAKIYLADVLADETGTTFTNTCGEWRITRAALAPCKTKEECEDKEGDVAPQADLKPPNPKLTTYDGFKWFEWSGIAFQQKYRLVFEVKLQPSDPTCKPDPKEFCRAGIMVLCRDGLAARSSIDTLDFQLTKALIDKGKAGVVYKGISGINEILQSLSNIYGDIEMCNESEIKAPAPAAVWYAVRFRWPTVDAKCPN